MKATPRTCSIKMISQPSTPPIAQMSTVRRLMGIGGVMNKFVKKRRTIPKIALTMSPPSELPPRPSTIKTTNTNKIMRIIGSTVL